VCEAPKHGWYYAMLASKAAARKVKAKTKADASGSFKTKLTLVLPIKRLIGQCVIHVKLTPSFISGQVTHCSLLFVCFLQNKLADYRSRRVLYIQTELN